MLSFKSAKGNTTLLQKLAEPKEDPVLNPIPVEVVGEYFIPRYKDVSKFLIKHIHAPVQLKELMRYMYDQDVFSVNKNKRALWVDCEQLVKNSPFLAWFDGILSRRLPLRVSHVIFSDLASKPLADKVCQYYNENSVPEPKILDAESIVGCLEEFSSVVVVSGVVRSGHKLLSISRDLRNKVLGDGKSISYFIGLFLPESPEKGKSFTSSLTYSSARNFKYTFEAWFSLCEGNLEESSWIDEKALLGRDELEHICEVERRLDVLNDGAGLREKCFWPSVSSKSLEIQKDFVFWFPDFDEANAINNANVFFTVSCLLQSTRNLKGGVRYFL